MLPCDDTRADDVRCDSSGELVEVPYMVTQLKEVESELVEVPAMVSLVSVEVE